jgi:sigma-E factor negative regulatory protein RseC
MTQIATVEKLIDQEYAEISVARESACGHECSDCAGCGLMGGAQEVRAVTRNRINARPGDRVVVESSTKKVMGVVMLVYVVPFVCFFAAYGIINTLGFGEALCAAGGIVCFLLGLLPALFYDRHVKKKGTLQYDIVRLL